MIAFLFFGEPSSFFEFLLGQDARVIRHFVSLRSVVSQSQGTESRLVGLRDGAENCQLRQLKKESLTPAPG